MDLFTEYIQCLSSKKSVDVMIGDVQTQFFYDRDEAVNGFLPLSISHFKITIKID